MEAKQKLKVGDVIRRFNVIDEIESDIVIARVTKTQAITQIGQKFKRDYEIGKFLLRLPHHIALVRPCKGHGYCDYNYYLIDKTKL
jgi:hypothetical protein